MIVVTGASGVLGQALMAELVRANEDIAVVSSGNVDLRDRSATLATFRDLRPRLVYHLAAKVHGLGGNRRYPAEMFADNVRINTNVVDAVLRVGCEKIVAVSTVAIYASDVPRPTAEASIWDGPPHASEAAYAHAKRAMLAHLNASAVQHGLRFVYPVMTNIYGAQDRFDVENGHVVPSLVAKFHAAAQTGGAVGVWGTGRAQRDFIHADDAARALTLLAAEGAGPINVATGMPVPIRRVVETLSELYGVDDVRWDDGKPDGQLLRSYDITKLTSLGFVPQVSLRDGLERTARWYDRNYPAVRV